MREQIQALVEELYPIDSLEKNHIDWVKAWIASKAPLCRIEKPANPPKHLVSYSVVIDPFKKKVLLADHKKSGLWLPTGGHVEPDEHPKETALRELKEELGIEFDLLLEKPLFITVTETVGSTAGHTDISLWYVFKGDSSQSLLFDEREFKTIH